MVVRARKIPRLQGYFSGIKKKVIMSYQELSLSYSHSPYPLSLSLTHTETVTIFCSPYFLMQASVIMSRQTSCQTDVQQHFFYLIVFGRFIPQSICLNLSKMLSSSCFFELTRSQLFVSIFRNNCKIFLIFRIIEMYASIFSKLIKLTVSRFHTMQYRSVFSRSH